MKNLLKIYDNFEPSFNLIRKGYNLFDEYQTKKHKKIITAFHRNLLEGDESQEKIKYEEEYIQANQDDYFLLLKLAINDEDEDKVDIYSSVYKYIRANQNIPKEEKKRIIIIAKSLPLSAIILLKELSEIFNDDYKSHESIFYKTTNNTKNRYEINLIIQCNIFINNDTELTNVIRIQPTSTYKYIIDSFFYSCKKDIR